MSNQPPNPLEETAEQIRGLQNDLNALQSGVRLETLRDELEDLDTSTNGLDQRIRDMRARGYVFEKELEARAANLKQRWAAQRLLVLQQITQQSASLDLEVRSLEMQMAQVSTRAGNPSAARPLIDQMRSTLSTLESRVTAAKSSIQGMYNAYNQELNGLTEHLKRVEWTFAQLAKACFQLRPTEAGVMAVEAVWVKDGKEDKGDPKGVLFLTDQRILFEQKQEVATKKVLFITTEKKKVQQLLVDTPVALLQNVTATKQGLFGHEDHIEMTFASGAPFYSVHFHLDGQDCNEWQGLLGKAKSKDFDHDRAVAIDQADIDKVKAAPAQCPTCGGTISTPVLRGMDSLTCEFCGYVIRL